VVSKPRLPAAGDGSVTVHDATIDKGGAFFASFFLSGGRPGASDRWPGGCDCGGGAGVAAAAERRKRMAITPGTRRMCRANFTPV